MKRLLKKGWCPPSIAAEDEADARIVLGELASSSPFPPFGVHRRGERFLVHPLFHDVVLRYGWERLAARAPEYRALFVKHGFEDGAKQLIGYARFVDGEVSLTVAKPPSC